MCNKIYFKNKLTFSEPRDFPIEEVENSFQPKGVISSLDDRTFPGFLLWNRNISLQSNHPYQHLKNSNDSYFNTNCRDISCTARSSELSCLFLFLIFCLFVFFRNSCLAWFPAKYAGENHWWSTYATSPGTAKQHRRVYH